VEDTNIFIDNKQYTILPIGVISETIVQFGAITGAFAQLVDLGQSKIYSHAFFINLLNQDVQLQFAASGLTMTIPFTVEGLALDSFLLNGIVNIKYRGTLATQGEFIFQCW
jgi:hypothetical protein